MQVRPLVYHDKGKLSKKRKTLNTKISLQELSKELN